MVIVLFFVKNLSCGGALRAISWQICGRFRSHVRQYTPAHPDRQSTRHAPLINTVFLLFRSCKCL